MQITNQYALTLLRRVQLKEACLLADNRKKVTLVQHTPTLIIRRINRRQAQVWQTKNDDDDGDDDDDDDDDD